MHITYIPTVKHIYFHAKIFQPCQFLVLILFLLNYESCYIILQ